jgi:autotransporter-associated beta strand protein
MSWNLGIYAADFLGTYKLPVGTTVINTPYITKGNLYVQAGAILDLNGQTFSQGITAIDGKVIDSTISYSQLYINDRTGQTILNGSLIQLNTVNIYNNNNLIVNSSTIGPGNVSSINVQGSGTLILSAVSNINSGLSIYGTGSITKIGSGTVIIRDINNTITGTFNVLNGGIIANSTGAALGSSTIVMGDSNNYNTSINFTGNGGFSPVSPIIINGNGFNVINANSNQSLLIQNTIQFNTGNNLTIVGSGTGGWRFYGNPSGVATTGNGDLTINSNTTNTSNQLRLQGNYNHTGKIINSGLGAQRTVLFGDPRALPTSPYQTYAGVIGSNVTTIVQNATASPFVIDSHTPSFVGAIQIVAGELWIGQVSNRGNTSASSTINISTGARLVFYRADSVVQGTHFTSFPITGGGGVTLNSGVVTFNNNNTYSGGTIINSGATAITGNIGAWGTGSITVNTGGTLNKNGYNITNTIINNGGTVNN